MIRSAIEIIRTPKYQCSKCVLKVSSQAREKLLGCTGKTKFKKKAEGFEYQRCPGNFYSPAYAQLLDVHRSFRKGVLGFEGGLLDQPSKYLDTMNYIENIVLGLELEQSKKSSNKGGKGGR